MASPAVNGNSDRIHVPLIVLGSGPAGCTAALYATRAGLEPILITGNEIGGQLTTTTDVDNWPGSYENLQGPDLMERMQRHVRHLGTRWIQDHIEAVDVTRQPFYLTGTEAGYHCDALIIATGASAKYLGLPSETQFKGRGVSACATCDGFFFRNRPVAVVGGGNTAAEEALYLSGLASKVSLIHRRGKLRADKILQDRLFARKNIDFLWHYTLDEIFGDPRGVNGIRVRSVTSPRDVKQLDVQGVFIAIGHQPNTGLFAGQLEMREGYLVTHSGLNGNSTQTSVPGVFAAGDVADHVYRQAITSAGFGCMAALDARNFLENLPH